LGDAAARASVAKLERLPLAATDPGPVGNSWIEVACVQKPVGPATGRFAQRGRISHDG
jgi:hypothetical protein